MTLEIRATEGSTRYDLYEDDERIGELDCALPDPDDPTDTDPPLWSARIWSAMGTGKTWSADGESYEQVAEYAHELYVEFAAERRELSKGSRTWTSSSFPAGGKPGWRRR